MDVKNLTGRLIELTELHCKQLGVKGVIKGNKILVKVSQVELLNQAMASALDEYRIEATSEGPNTKEEFFSWTMSNLNPSERALVNFNIYLVDSFYHSLYHCGMYALCRKHLEEFRWRLHLRYTPPQYKKQALQAVVDSGGMQDPALLWIDDGVVKRFQKFKPKAAKE